MIQTSGTGTSGKRSRLPLIAAIVAGVLLIVGIRYVTTRGDAPAAAAAAPGTAAPSPRAGCTTVQIAASSEKAALIGRIANSYRESGRTVNGRCYDIAVTAAASGTAEATLAAGWDLTANDRANIVGDSPTFASVTSTPLVLAMPQPMATTLGWPDTPIGWSDVLTLARDPQGWAAKGHPEWG